MKKIIFVIALIISSSVFSMEPEKPEKPEKKIQRIIFENKVEGYFADWTIELEWKLDGKPHQHILEPYHKTVLGPLCLVTDVQFRTYGSILSKFSKWNKISGNQLHDLINYFRVENNQDMIVAIIGEKLQGYRIEVSKQYRPQNAGFDVSGLDGTLLSFFPRVAKHLERVFTGDEEIVILERLKAGTLPARYFLEVNPDASLEVIQNRFAIKAHVLEELKNDPKWKGFEHVFKTIEECLTIAYEKLKASAN